MNPADLIFVIFISPLVWTLIIKNWYTPSYAGPLLKFDFSRSQSVSFPLNRPVLRKETRMTIQDFKNLNHSVWECKYHIVFIPKYRKKVFFGVLRKQIGTVFRKLASQKGCEISEGHIMHDNVHLVVSIPPKIPVKEIGRSEVRE